MVFHSALTGTELHPPLGTSTVGALALPTNVAGAMLWQNGANDLLRVNTTTGAVAVILGNATDNPTYSWLGSGSATFAGPIVAGTIRGVNGSGTNSGGTALNVSGGIATGNAAAGDLVLLGSNAGGSGSSLQSGVERARLVGATGEWRTGVGAHGQYASAGWFEEVVNLTSGVHQDTVGTIPANAIVLFAPSRVTTTITGPAAWKIGRATDANPNRYGDSLALASGTTAAGLDSAGSPQHNASAVAIRIQAQDGVTAFTAGAVRVTAYWWTVQPPTS